MNNSRYTAILEKLIMSKQTLIFIVIKYKKPLQKIEITCNR
jgi:hypothetical protein